MNTESVAFDKASLEDFIRSQETLRKRHMDCAQVIADRIRGLLDSQDIYERAGSFVAPASEEPQPAQQDGEPERTPDGIEEDMRRLLEESRKAAA